MLAMKRILILLASLLVVGNVYGLPAYPSSPPFDNCYGAQTELFPEEVLGVTGHHAMAIKTNAILDEVEWITQFVSAS